MNKLTYLENEKNICCKELEMLGGTLQIKEETYRKEIDIINQYNLEKTDMCLKEHDLQDKIKNCKEQIEIENNKMDKYKREIASLRDNYNLTFIFAFVKKKEIREKIDVLENKIKESQDLIDVLFNDFNFLNSNTKMNEINDCERKINESNEKVLILEEQIKELKMEINKRSQFLREIDEKIIIEKVNISSTEIINKDEEQVNKLDIVNISDEQNDSKIDIEKDNISNIENINKEGEQANKLDIVNISDEQNDEKTSIKNGDISGIENMIKDGKQINKEDTSIILNEEKQNSIPFFELYNIDVEDYKHFNVDELGFSVRLYNCVKQYKTLDKLLLEDDSKLSKVRGYGRKCEEELHTYLKNISPTKVSDRDDIFDDNLIDDLSRYKEELVSGDFSFVDSMVLSKKLRESIEFFRTVHEIVDHELIENAYKGSPEVYRIMEMLQNYVNTISNKRIVDSYMKNIPSNRLVVNVKTVIKYYTDDEHCIQYLSGFVNDDNQTLRDYIYSNISIVGTDNSIIRFMKWCQFDVLSEISYFFEDKLKERELFVINRRASSDKNINTLEAIGENLSLTRERVRQIENKSVNKFNIFQRQSRIIYKMFLDFNEEEGLTSSEIIEYLDKYGNELVFLMKKCDNAEINYDSQLDMFIFDDLSLSEKIQQYVENLPKSFSEKDLLNIEKEVKEKDYSYKMVKTAIDDNYELINGNYLRTKMTLADIYKSIIEKYYPIGIHVGNPDVINAFKKYVKDDCNLDISDKSMHSIGSLISRICILCGRGTYKIREEKKYISDSLAKDIHDYVEMNDENIILIKSLFVLFEERLLEEGITDRYYLQGILKSFYENEWKWIFRRDYIAKNETDISFYSSIINYIKASQVPVSKEDIFNKYPGITDIIINIAVSDESVINLFGMYLHSSKLKISENDKKYLKTVLESYLEKKDFCHSKDLFDYINNDYPSLLANNYIQYQFGLFSLYECLFGDDYIFSRPFIAREDATIERALDTIKDIISETDIIKISDIMSMARSYNAIIYSIREFLDECNASHLIINNNEIASIDYIGITENIAKEIEKRLVDEITTTIPIHELKSLHSLPKINVEWNVWLIYSILKKWSTRLEVGVSNKQFRQAYPIVAPKGTIDMSRYSGNETNGDSKIYISDDLSNIDNLIEILNIEELGDTDDI